MPWSEDHMLLDRRQNAKELSSKISACAEALPKCQRQYSPSLRFLFRK